MRGKEKERLIRIIAALVAFFAVFIADKVVGLQDVFAGKAGWVLPFALYAAVYVWIGYDVLWRAARNIAHGQIFDENFLMCVATLGAFALAITRGVRGMETEGFDEACAVLLFYQIGEFFQSYAAGRSRRSVAGLMDIRPDHADVLRANEVVRVSPEEVETGERIVIQSGERVPLDGVILSGASALDTHALTGESAPRNVREGDEVLSGCVNLSSRLIVTVTKPYHDGTVAKILDLVENASAQKSKTENFITKFARVYTPAVVAAAVLIAVLPSLITGHWSTWVYRALSFLVVSCPCALVISVPLAFFSGIGAASRYGILIKGAGYLEKFDRARTFVFDKTGTLTRGNFAVTSVSPAGDRERILRLAAIAEQGSSHPIAVSVSAAYGKTPESGYTPTVYAGKGVVAVKGNDRIACGNAALMDELHIAYTPLHCAGTTVYVAQNDTFVGSLVIEDEIKEEAPAVIGRLNALGCRTVMLTGDNAAVAAAVAEKTGVSEYKASLLPQNKVEQVENLLQETKRKESLCFVGDGINDAPVLMRADIGIAMGGVGSDAAIEASDIVLMHDDLRGLVTAKRIARKTMRTVFINIAFALFVKLAILALSAFGITNMWVAVFGDVGVAVICILLSMCVFTGAYNGIARSP